MPPLTSTIYPNGDYDFECSFDDELTGLPVRERHALRDHRARLRDRRDLDQPDRSWFDRQHTRRTEYPDVDP